MKLVICLPLLCALVAQPARAEPAACAADKPWVAVSGDVPAPFADALRSDLRAGLTPSNIDVCEAGSTEPLARVVVKHVEGAHYSLDVTDSVTQKRLGRDLSLGDVPADGRAFALAVAAEELLRASWAELALRGARSPETAPPPEVRAIVEQSKPKAAPTRFLALGSRLGFEHFLGGQTHYGGDLFAWLPVGRVAAGMFALGARRALSEHAPHGDISASAFAAEAGVALAFVRRGGTELSALGSARLLRVRFEPKASSGAVADAQSGLAFTSRLGLAFAFGSSGLLRSYSSLGAGLPLKSFSAADNGGTVTGVSQLELFAATGIALELP